MVNNKQRREAARRHLQRQLERRQEAERRRKKATQLIAAIIGLAVVAAAIIVTLVVTGGGDDDEDTPTVAAGACSYTTGGTPAKPVSPPSTEDVPDSGTVEASIATNNGVIPITLDRANAPCAVNSFVSLAEQGYFDQTPCHRLTTGGLAVLQCGDPTGTGTGGPGYSYADELTGSERYTRGVVAMANSGPNTNGSQFFLVYGDSTGLSPNYVVLGSIGETGLAVLDTIAAAGVVGGGTDGDPALATTIDQVTLDGGAGAPAATGTP